MSEGFKACGHAGRFQGVEGNAEELQTERNTYELP